MVSYIKPVSLFSNLLPWSHIWLPSWMPNQCLWACLRFWLEESRDFNSTFKRESLRPFNESYLKKHLGIPFHIMICSWAHGKKTKNMRIPGLGMFHLSVWFQTLLLVSSRWGVPVLFGTVSKVKCIKIELITWVWSVHMQHWSTGWSRELLPRHLKLKKAAFIGWGINFTRYHILPLKPNTANSSGFWLN